MPLIYRGLRFQAVTLDSTLIFDSQWGLQGCDYVLRVDLESFESNPGKRHPVSPPDVYGPNGNCLGTVPTKHFSGASFESSLHPSPGAARLLPAEDYDDYLGSAERDRHLANLALFRVSLHRSLQALLIFGVAYPPSSPAVDLEKIAYKYYKPSPALDKVLAINRRTGIKARSLISPILDLSEPASIKETSEIFLKEGLALALSASRLAIAEAGLAVEEITHVVATTCTNSSNPGYDSFLAQELGLRPSVEKVLLHGVGCAGGLAALRLAASIERCEITSSMLRDELRIIDRDQQVRLGITLFGDGAASLILSLDPGDVDPMNKSPKGIYELVNWSHLTVPDTHSDLRIDVTSTGFKPTLSARIPALTAPCTPLLYDALLNTLPNKSSHSTLPTAPTDFDWAVHPGGGAILAGIQTAMGVEKEHMKASWEVYENHGNTTSVSVLHVLDTLRREPGREGVMSAAFGPGVTAEGCLLRRAQ
ncbi:thiolase-like protein [Mycena galopus ATCC 62051]|nr:thiolase-like protein [Mycena galopus ATCC 62051]